MKATFKNRLRKLEVFQPSSTPDQPMSRRFCQILSLVYGDNQPPDYTITGRRL
jgi:hypothetical protein